jgi:hypothetical protein
VNNDYVDKAKGLLSEIGVHQLSEGAWAFTDVHIASQAYIHHSREPVALAAYAALTPRLLLAVSLTGRWSTW